MTLLDDYSGPFAANDWVNGSELWKARLKN
jgi:hypothetical protein